MLFGQGLGNFWHVLSERVYFRQGPRGEEGEEGSAGDPVSFNSLPCNKSCLEMERKEQTNVNGVPCKGHLLCLIFKIIKNARISYGKTFLHNVLHRQSTFF